MSRDRDRQLETALRRELRAAGAPDRNACLDAETIGAWVDGGLEAAQMAAVESHVSTCARCRVIAGIAVRSAPPAGGPQAAGLFSWRWWFAPIAATAAAVTLWMVVPRERNIVVAPPPAAAPVPETFAHNQPKEQAKIAEERKATADRPESTIAPEQTRSVRRERPADSAAKAETGVAAKKLDENAPKPTTTDTVTITSAAPPPGAAAPAVPELQKRARAASAPVEIVSPDPSRRWRIVNGAVERSEDGGASWIAVRQPAGDSITGGTSPAPTICWLIGSGGLVLVAADGSTFARVSLPERVDLTAVTASDARTAVVTAADGRRFRTDDSGRNWRRN